MKKYIFLILTLITFLFAACSNIFEDSISNAESSSDSSTNISDNGKESVKYIAVTGSINLEGAYPQEILNQVQNISSSNRTAFPTAPALTDCASFNITAVYGTAQTVAATGEIISGSSNSSYRINIPAGDTAVNYKIKIEAYAHNNKILTGLSEEFTITRNSPTSVKNVTLSTVTSEGTGTFSLSVNIATDAGINSAKIIYKNNNGDTVSIQTGKASNACTFAKGTIGTYAITNGVECGSYLMTFEFYSGSIESTHVTGNLVYSFKQTVNIFNGLETNTWVKNGAEPYLSVSGGTTTCTITKAMVDSYALADLYVKAGASESGTGSFLSPLPSISKAVEKMHNKDVDYIIHVDGAVTGSQVIPATLKSDGSGTYNAKSVTLCGVTGDSVEDVLNGNFTGTGDSKGHTLSILTTVPVTITKLNITGGKGEANGGGIYVSASQPSLTLGTGAVVSGNEATGNGAGIFIESTHATNKATLTMCSTAQVSGNSAGNYGGGIYMSKTNFYLYDSAVVGDTGKSTYAESDTSKHSNTAKSGGGIYASASTVNIGYTSADTPSENCYYGVMYNYSSGTYGKGGGVFCTNETKFYLAKGNVSYNATYAGEPGTYNGGEGGGVYIDSNINNQFRMSGGNIAKNKSAYGGGINSKTSDFQITGGTIGDTTDSLATADNCSNYARMGGGGIDLEVTATDDTYISGGTIARNYCGSAGGGIFCSSDTGTITVNGSVVIQNNYSAISGGGIEFTGKLTLGAEMKNNQVASGKTGGGVYMDDVADELTLQSGFKITTDSYSPTKGKDDISMQFQSGEESQVFVNDTLSNFSTDKQIALVFFNDEDLFELIAAGGCQNYIINSNNSTEPPKFKLLTNLETVKLSYVNSNKCAELDLDYSKFSFDDFTPGIIDAFSGRMNEPSATTNILPYQTPYFVNLNGRTLLLKWTKSGYTYFCAAKFSVYEATDLQGDDEDYYIKMQYKVYKGNELYKSISMDEFTRKIGFMDDYDWELDFDFENNKWTTTQTSTTNIQITQPETYAINGTSWTFFPPTN